MDKFVIEINGVRHTLVKNKRRWFDCDLCSLADLCRKKEVLLCNIADSSDNHFEIRKD